MLDKKGEDGGKTATTNGNICNFFTNTFIFLFSFEYFDEGVFMAPSVLQCIFTILKLVIQRMYPVAFPQQRF